MVTGTRYENSNEGTGLRDYVVAHVEEAVEKGWVLPYYQPVVRTLTGKLCGFEALARWDDPVYGLKIDMAFLNRFGEKSKTILASVVDMAKKLGIQTLAEGVETEEHRAYLRRIGCEKMQGYLFGRPMPYSPELADELREPSDDIITSSLL